MDAKVLYHKTYQARKYIALHKRLKIKKGDDSVVIDIEFTGGGHSNNRKITGKYSTSDAAIQEALEKNPGFNTEYRLIRSDKIGIINQKEDSQPDETGLETGDEQGEDVKAIEDVKTVGEARQYIIDNYKDDIQVSKIRNKSDVLKAAKTLNIEFPNIPE
jgi:hypothetical protein